MLILALAFSLVFTPKTMRLDYFHTGDHGHEIVALDRVVSDGPWAGSTTHLLDDLNLGTYYFEVVDPQTNQTIYSRGFASLYGEWEDTAEAKIGTRTFHESLRFPWPKAPVQVVLKKRGKDNLFREIWTTRVDPSSPAVNAADVAPAGKVWTVFENGPPTEKVDLLILGEGYTAAEMPKFHADVKRLTDKLFATEPFKSRRSDFNVRAIDLPAATSGVNRPHVGKFRRTAVSAEYYIFESERYMLTYDNRTLRDVLSEAPYEFIEILANEKQYGGGGIYNFEATASVDTAFAEYVFVHEFGHHFAGLADEYYMSPGVFTAFPADAPEPWEPNITALRDPAHLKWGDLALTSTPLPTPWDKDAWEKVAKEFLDRRLALIKRAAPESEFDALFREQQKSDTPMLGGMKYSGKVGAFEGASYQAKGLYRPQTDCIMYTRDEVGFCKVCRKAIERVIDMYSK
ncbi:MAG TPA: IgA Peptidase M64 [Candidatus Polarisedimenticolaceae bacterium]|nr:IgA Peptidase M64 [Candidatus Polarisedimenticolaceae bacterium]